MKKYYCLLTFVALFAAQQSWAATDGGPTKECKPIVKACIKGGYGKKANEGKAFWRDCMHPVLLGKAVANVNVDTNDVAACRKAKISKMELELEQLKQMDSK